MNFEEDFPNFTATVEAEFDIALDTGDPFCTSSLEDIKELLSKHCLDKQKVRDALTKIIKEHDDHESMYHPGLVDDGDLHGIIGGLNLAIRILKQELGL